MKAAAERAGVARLNPYYTGIHLHTEHLQLGFMSMDFVLILIILEYIYIFGIGFFIGIIVYSLNPYYTGIHLHKICMRISE